MWLSQETNETSLLSAPFWVLAVFSLCLFLILSLSLCLPPSFFPFLCLSGLRDGKLKHSVLSGCTVLELLPLEKDRVTPWAPNLQSQVGLCLWQHGSDARGQTVGFGEGCSTVQEEPVSFLPLPVDHSCTHERFLDYWGKLHQIKNVYPPYWAVFLLFIYFLQNSWQTKSESSLDFKILICSNYVLFCVVFVQYRTFRFRLSNKLHLTFHTY